MVARSSGAQAFLLTTAVLTAALLWWIKGFGTTHAATRLTLSFVYLFTTFDYPAAVWALLMVVAVAFVPQKYSFRPLLSWISDNVWVVAGVVCVVLCTGTWVFYLHHPFAQDEAAPEFQSRIFAAGHLTGQFPPGLIERLISLPYQNNFYFISQTSGRIISTYWPGFALLLTPFTFFGIPWACNPVISALTLPVIQRLALRIFADRETAGLAVLLTLAAPVFFADGISYYSMSAHLLANCVYALLLLDPTPRRALLAGVVGSVALVLHNPVPHMLFAIPWMLFIARRADAARLIGCLLLGYLPLCLLLGFGWAYLGSSLAKDGATVATVGVRAPGDMGRFLTIFSLPDQAIWIARGIGVIKVWVWAVPGTVLLALLGAWKWRHHPVCRVLGAAALVTLLGYLLMPADQGHGWGYRYFHSAWMVVPLFAAGALAPLPAGVRSSSTPTWLGRVTEDAGVRTCLVACALLSLTFGCGLRAVQIHEFIAESTYRALPAYAGTEHRVVLLNGEVDLMQVDPWLRGNVIYLSSLGPEKDATTMQRYFPGLHRVFSDSAGAVWSAAPARQVR